MRLFFLNTSSGPVVFFLDPWGPCHDIWLSWTRTCWQQLTNPVWHFCLFNHQNAGLWNLFSLSANHFPYKYKVTPLTASRFFSFQFQTCLEHKLHMCKYCEAVSNFPIIVKKTISQNFARDVRFRLTITTYSRKDWNPLKDFWCHLIRTWKGLLFTQIGWNIHVCELIDSGSGDKYKWWLIRLHLQVL